MIVYGCEISDHQIDVVFSKVINQTNFTCSDLIFELSRVGVHSVARNRAADRLIQKWKKEGKIFYDKGNQCWRNIKVKHLFE